MWSESGIRVIPGFLFGLLVFIDSARRRELPITKIKNTVGQEGGAGESEWGSGVKLEMCPLHGCICESAAQGRGLAWRCMFGSCWWIGGI